MSVLTHKPHHVRWSISDRGLTTLPREVWPQEARQEKTDLTVFVVVIPKEGLVGWH